MIFAFHDKGELTLLDSLESVYSKYDGLDVEAGAITFYDADGRPLYPCFTTPNRYGRTLGITWSSAGTYHLKPDHIDSQPSLQHALATVRRLAPNPWYPSLHMLCLTFDNRRNTECLASIAA